MTLRKSRRVAFAAQATILVLVVAILGGTSESGISSLHAAVGLLGLVALGLVHRRTVSQWSRWMAEVADATRRTALASEPAVSASEQHDETAPFFSAVQEIRNEYAGHIAQIDHQLLMLNALLTQLREGVLVADPEGRMVMVNPEAVRLLGLTSPLPDGSFEGVVLERCIPQHDLQEMLRPRGPELERGADEIRLWIDGSAGPVSLLARAGELTLPADTNLVPGAAAGRLGRLVVLTDVTHMARTMQMKADFASNASHELRTPLAAIVAACETLRSLGGGQIDPVVEKLLDVIDRQGRHMHAMVADLLDLARMESPASKFEPQPIVLPLLLREIHAAFEVKIRDKDLHWRTSIPSEGQTLVAAPELLRLILRNLIENAVNFTPKGGEVSVELQMEAQAWIVIVEDNGCGIPADELPRVFERFYQVSRSRSGPDRGTGLGLSIVRHAVAAMGATLDLQSVVGHGTRVSICILRP